MLIQGLEGRWLVSSYHSVGQNDFNYILLYFF